MDECIEVNREPTKRVALGNMVFRLFENQSKAKYIIMNLYSFRRMILSDEEYKLFCDIAVKCMSGDSLSKSEANFYKVLIDHKQILSETDKKEYDDLRSKKLQSMIENISPLVNSITITPTYSCNFRCQYCYQRDFENKERSMTTEDVDAIARYIRYINGGGDISDQIRAVNINGGEACQRKNVEVINHILETFGKNGNCEFTMFSNGSNILELKNSIDYTKFTKIQISLDGEENAFLKINQTNEKNLLKVIEAIKYLSSLCSSIDVVCMITRHLIDNIDSFYRRLKTCGVLLPNVKFNLAYISNYESCELDEEFLSLKELADFHKVLSKKPYSNCFAMNTLFESRYITPHLFSKNSRDVPIRDFSCGVLAGRGLMFSPDGNVYWCICVKQSEGIIGNYHNPTSDDIVRIREYCSRTIHKNERCKECELKYICTGGCPLYLIAQKRSPKDEFCGLYKNRYYMDHLEDFLW